MNWKRKKGKYTLESCGYVYRVEANGKISIRDPQGGWEHLETSSVDEAKGICEELCKAREKLASIRSSLRDELVERAKWMQRHPKEVSYAISCAKVLYAYVQLPDEQKEAGLAELDARGLNDITWVARNKPEHLTYAKTLTEKQYKDHWIDIIKKAVEMNGLRLVQ